MCACEGREHRTAHCFKCDGPLPDRPPKPVIEPQLWQGDNS